MAAALQWLLQLLRSNSNVLDGQLCEVFAGECVIVVEVRQSGGRGE